MKKEQGVIMILTAITVEEIKFFYLNNELILIKNGSKVVVDTNRSIAYFNGICFDISTNEYSILN